MDYNGEISCWGDNYYGQTDAPEGTFIDIFVGHYTACALDEERLMTCWGYSGYGNTDAPEVEFRMPISERVMSVVSIVKAVFNAGEATTKLSYTDFDGDGNDKLLDCNDFYKSLHVYDYDGDGYSSCDGDRDDYDETSIPVDADGDGFRSADGIVMIQMQASFQSMPMEMVFQQIAMGIVMTIISLFDLVLKSCLEMG